MMGYLVRDVHSEGRAIGIGTIMFAQTLDYGGKTLKADDIDYWLCSDSDDSVHTVVGEQLRNKYAGLAAHRSGKFGRMTLDVMATTHVGGDYNRGIHAWMELVDTDVSTEPTELGEQDGIDKRGMNLDIYRAALTVVSQGGCGQVHIVGG